MSYHSFLIRLLTTTLLIVLMIGMWYLRSILMLGFLAVVIAVLLNLPVQYLTKRGLGRGLSVAVAAIGFGILSVLLTLWMLPTMLIELTNLVAKLPDALVGVGTLYEQWRANSMPIRSLLPPLLSQEAGQAQAILGLEQSRLNEFAINALNSMLPVLQGIGSITLTTLANLAVVMFMSIFFLIEPEAYGHASLMLIPPAYHQRAKAIGRELYHTLTLWITAQSISVTITVVLVWFVLGVVLQMHNAVIVAVFAGIATFIPNIGAFLPLIPIIVFTVIEDPNQLFIIASIYLLIQLVESNVLTPFLVKTELAIPIGGLLLFQVIAAVLFGALGVLLAAPLLAVIITLVREIYSYEVLGLRQLQPMMESEPSTFSQLQRRAGNGWRRLRYALTTAASRRFGVRRKSAEEQVVVDESLGKTEQQGYGETMGADYVS